MDKPILDACCGGRMFWFDKSHPKVIFSDKRSESLTVGNGKNKRTRTVKPDILMDFRDMKFKGRKIKSELFSLVVFDPPHLFLGENASMAAAYGRLERGTWKDDITAGFKECFRGLKKKKNGVLIFKWNESDIPIGEVLSCTNIQPLFGHKSGKAAKTHWICFMKF